MKVLRAARYLVENSSLFKEAGIHVSDRYIEDNADRLSHRENVSHRKKILLMR